MFLVQEYCAKGSIMEGFDNEPLEEHVAREHFRSKAGRGVPPLPKRRPQGHQTHEFATTEDNVSKLQTLSRGRF